MSEMIIYSFGTTNWAAVRIVDAYKEPTAEMERV